MSFRNGEFYPGFDGEDGTGSGDYQDPDTGSSENVKEDLERADRMLREAGHLPSSETEDEMLSRGLSGPRREVFLTQAEFVESIRSTLARLGVENVADITEARLLSADEAIGETLNPYTAECLVFETAKKSRRRLGNEPIRVSRLIQQARILNKRGLDLEKLQLGQRVRALDGLYQTAIDPEQIQRMLRGREGMKQNINRLHFLMFQEPVLQPLTRSLAVRHNRGEVIKVERVLKIAKILLCRRITSWNDLKDKQSMENEDSWDSIDWDTYKRATQRMRASKEVIKMIEEEMQAPTTLEEFRREMDF